MAKAKMKKCPLCGSMLEQKKYDDILGVWDAKKEFEAGLKDKLKKLKNRETELMESVAKQKIELGKKEREMKKNVKQAVMDGVAKGIGKEKKRADMLAKSIDAKATEIQGLNKKIEELKEQLKKGTTPQMEGFDLEKKVLKDLKIEFDEDVVTAHGKGGDIIQEVFCKGKSRGKILYECKATTKYSNKFIKQIKTDMGYRKTTYGVLVTVVQKKNTAGFFVEKDIIVVHPFGVVSVAKILRNSMIELSLMNIEPGEKDKRAKKLMEYIQSENFKNIIEDNIFRTSQLYDALKKELKTHKKIWEERYKNYKAINENSNVLKNSTMNIMMGSRYDKKLVEKRVKLFEPIE
ncbi:MAG: hypothetical protein JXR81_06290 [Candidatus Goldbacteria bacterium]|nr:hypothetical protein [Candidatus Goldiibacteriota bacterium]